MRAISSSTFSSCGVTSVEPAATKLLSCWRRLMASGALITAFTVFTFGRQQPRCVDGLQVSDSRARAEIACSDVSYRLLDASAAKQNSMTSANKCRFVLDTMRPGVRDHGGSTRYAGGQRRE
jgi:hypothetical protein